MTVIRIQTEPERLGDYERAALSESLTRVVLDVEVGADSDVARSGIMVLFDERPVERWALGGSLGHEHAGMGQRVLVDVQVMAADWTPERRQRLLSGLAGALGGSLGMAPEEMRSCWILLQVVPDGSWGWAGGVIRAADIVGAFGAEHAADVRRRLDAGEPI